MRGWVGGWAGGSKEFRCSCEFGLVIQVGCSASMLSNTAFSRYFPAMCRHRMLKLQPHLLFARMTSPAIESPASRSRRFHVNRTQRLESSKKLGLSRFGDLKAHTYASDLVSALDLQPVCVPSRCETVSRSIVESDGGASSNAGGSIVAPVTQLDDVPLVDRVLCKQHWPLAPLIGWKDMLSKGELFAPSTPIGGVHGHWARCQVGGHYVYHAASLASGARFVASESGAQ